MAVSPARRAFNCTLNVSLVQEGNIDTCIYRASLLLTWAAVVCALQIFALAACQIIDLGTLEGVESRAYSVNAFVGRFHSYSPIIWPRSLVRSSSCVVLCAHTSLGTSGTTLGATRMKYAVQSCSFRNAATSAISFEFSVLNGKRVLWLL